MCYKWREKLLGKGALQAELEYSGYAGGGMLEAVFQKDVSSSNSGKHFHATGCFLWDETAQIFFLLLYMPVLIEPIDKTKVQRS